MEKYAPRLKYKSRKDTVKKALVQYVLSNAGVELNKILPIANKIHFKEWYKIAENLNEQRLKPSYELPWKEIDVGIKTSYLKQEAEKILKNEITPWCETDGCTNCGSCIHTKI